MKNLNSGVDKNNNLKVLRLLLPYLWPKEKLNLKARVILAFGLLLLSKILNVYMPLLYKQSIDALGIPTTTLTFASTPILLILAYGSARLGAQIFNELKDAISARVEHHAMREVARNVFKHLHALSLRFHLDRKTGGLSRIIERGVKGIETILRFMLFNILPIAFEMVFVSIVLWNLYDISYTAITLVTLIFYISATIKLTQWRIQFVRSMNTADNDANSKAIDSLLNFETVKYFGNESHEAARYDSGLAAYEEAAIRGKRSLSFLNVTQGTIICIGLISLMIMAAFDVTNGKMQIGDFVLVNTYLIQLYLPLNILGFAYREIKLATVNMEEMFGLLQVPQEIRDPQTPAMLSNPKGNLTFDRVSFHYNSDRPILKDLSFTVPSGKTIAIVGSSGAGKSTLSRLLFRFYDVQAGSITIDGIDIRHLRQHDLRQIIGIVPQDTVLFNDTIFYNIAYGNIDACEQDVFKAAKLAKIHDFILSLPQGYETLVGERGLKLSGGEKQRVAIARTLLKRPAIFLFDEATSALDTQTEKNIQQSLKDVSQNHTTLIIAHRLSTIVDADEIIVLDKGTIQERGNHTDLLKHNGLYAEMWRKQRTHSAKQS